MIKTKLYKSICRLINFPIDILLRTPQDGGHNFLIWDKRWWKAFETDLNTLFDHPNSWREYHSIIICWKPCCLLKKGYRKYSIIRHMLSNTLPKLQEKASLKITWWSQRTLPLKDRAIAQSQLILIQLIWGWRDHLTDWIRFVTILWG